MRLFSRKSTNNSNSLQLSVVTLIILCLLSYNVAGRKWEDVISASIYAKTHVDVPKLQFSLEENPFDALLRAPTMTQTYPPSDAPSSVPSYFGDPTFNGNNKGCNAGESKFIVNKYDIWGDGWGEATLSIRQVGKADDVEEIDNESSFSSFGTVDIGVDISEDTTMPPRRGSFNYRKLEGTTNHVVSTRLENGDFDSQTICLSHVACYEVTLQGGKWQEEARWEILPDVDVNDGTTPVAIAKGQGFSNCTFYTSEYPPIIGDELLDCKFTCRPRYYEDEQNNSSVIAAGSVAGTEETKPTSVPTIAATSPTGAPSDFPSLVPTM